MRNMNTIIFSIYIIFKDISQQRKQNSIYITQNILIIWFPAKGVICVITRR